MRTTRYLLALVALCSTVAYAGVVPTRITEIRINDPGLDDQEYFELRGEPSASLSGLTYVIIGDFGANGGILEFALDLTGQSLDANGRFLAAHEDFTLAVADVSIPNPGLGIFENNEQKTHLLVEGFTGSGACTSDDDCSEVEVCFDTNADGDADTCVTEDLDTNDDGTLETTPWTSVADCVAFLEDPAFGDDDPVYCDTQLGPDDTFVPAHVYLCEPQDTWIVGVLDSFANDTPDAENPACVCGDVGTGNCFQDNGTGFCDNSDCCQNVIDFFPDLDCELDWNQACADAAFDECTEGGDPPDVTLSEIRSGQSGSDDDHFFELRAAVGTSLNGVSYIVIGDEGEDGPSGVIEAVVELSGLVPGVCEGDPGIICVNDGMCGGNAPCIGIFVAAETTFTFGVVPDLTTELNFEDGDNVTHMLVFNFVGSLGDDIDTNDDGVIDVIAWQGDPIDAVAIIGDGTPCTEPEPGRFIHCIYETDPAKIVGPDDLGPAVCTVSGQCCFTDDDCDGGEDVCDNDVFVPGHVYLCEPGSTWEIGEFIVADPGSVDTPRAPNASCSFVPPCESVNAGDCFCANGTPHCEEQDGPPGGEQTCCEFVESEIATCGTTGWDQSCADKALLECLDCGVQSAGNCLEDNGTPYCSNLTCCELICTSHDATCCQLDGWDQACADLADIHCDIPPPVLPGDVVLGLATTDVFTTMELARGPVEAGGGETTPDSWEVVEENFGIQSMEFDNLDGIQHNPQGNLLAIAFGGAPPANSGGAIYNLATQIATSAHEFIGDTVGMGGAGLTPSRLNGLSISPNNDKIAVVGQDSGQVIVYDYTPGDGKGAGASLSGARETSGLGLCAGDTQGTAWKGNDTVLAFSASGEVFVIVAATMIHTEVAVVSTGACGPGFTDLEYNLALSPFVYAMYSSFTGGVTNNTLFVLDPDSDYDEVGVFTYAINSVGSINTAREIAFGPNGDLFVTQYGGDDTPTGPIIDVLPNACNLASLASDCSFDWYVSGPDSSFSGIDVALGGEVGCAAAPKEVDCEGGGGSDCNDACPQDVDLSGDVRVPDLIVLLGCWGPLPGLDPACPCLDDDGSGDIRVPDLIKMLGEWGVCP